jgi:hypothetical protein
MKKLLVVALATLTLFTGGMARADRRPFVAQGGTRVNIRRDPDDTTSYPDIWQVGTYRGARKSFFGVASWDELFTDDINADNGNWYAFKLDTYGRGSTDRVVYLYYLPEDDEFHCQLQDYRTGDILATRVANKPSSNVVQCRLPTKLFRIDGPVHFFVEAVNGFSVVIDRAPDGGRYQGL